MSGSLAKPTPPAASSCPAAPASDDAAALRDRVAGLEAELLSLRDENRRLTAEEGRREEERARTEGQLGQRLHELHSIYQLSEATSRAEDLRDLYGEALRLLREELGAARSAILLSDRDGVMRFVAHSGLSAEYRRLVAGHSPWPRGENNPTPLLIANVEESADLGALREVVLREGVRALGFVPLLNHGRLLGKLMVYYTEPHLFDDEQAQLLQTTARHIAIAIDRQQREDALARARERLRVVVSSSPVVLYALDRDMTITLIEGRGLNALDMRPEDLLGRKPSELFPLSDEMALHHGRALTGESGTVFYEIQGLCFETRYSPLRDETGQIIGSTGVATDVTERRRAEAELAFLAEASTLLAASLDYPATLDTVTGLFVPRLCDFCVLYTTEEGAPRAVATRHADPALGPVLEALAMRSPAGLPEGHPALAVLRGAGPVCEAELDTARLRPGTADEDELALWVRLQVRARLCVPLVLSGKVQGAVLLGAASRRYEDRDVLRAEELARRSAMALTSAALHRKEKEAVRAREELISIASHEVRAPLNTLHLQLQLLLRSAQKGQLDAIAKDRLIGMLESGERQVRSLSELIQKLFDLTRITAGQLDLHLEDVDLSQLLREVVTRFTAELERIGSRVELRAEAACPGCWDRLRLEQVVTNLIANAMKYGAGKPIEIEVLREGGLARLSVADQGIGIAPEHQEQIFERYGRAAGRGYAGLGLGLYIVRTLLTAMGGTVRVSSQLGAGSTFIVELPCGERKDPAPAAV